MGDPVRPLLMIAGAEVVAVVLLVGGVLAAVSRSDLGAGLVAAEVGMWALVLLGLALVWIGLYRRRRAARTPFLLVQAFALVVAWTFVGSDVVAWQAVGVLLGVGGALGIVLGLRPAVRQALH